MSGRLARFYPGLFDAVLVIACVAAVMLSGRALVGAVLGVAGGHRRAGRVGATDVLHAMSYALRQRPTEGVVAAAPVVAVLLAFSLLLTLLRQSRPRPGRRRGPARPAARLIDGGPSRPPPR